MPNDRRYVNQSASGSPTDLRHEAVHGAVLAEVYSLLRTIAQRGQPEREAADESAASPGESGTDLPRREPARREGRARP